MSITPLSRACQFGHTDIVEYLLEKGAEPNLLALSKAIEGQYEKCVRQLLFQLTNNKGWRRIKFRSRCEELLCHTDYTAGNDPTTPFCELIKHMPKVAEQVLHNCVKYERFMINSKNFKVKLNYELIDDISLNNNRLSHSSEETDHSKRPRLGLCCSEVCFDERTHPLSLMVKYKRESLLAHPVVAGLIHDKWRKYAKWNLLYLATYIMCYLWCINALLFTILNDNCMSDTMKTTELESGSAGSGLLDTLNCNCSGRNTIIGFATAIYPYSFVRCFFEITQFFFSIGVAFRSLQCKKDIWFYLLGAITRIDYIQHLENLIELPLFLLSICFSSIVLSKSCLSVSAWQIGVTVFFLAWIEFIFLLTQFQIIGRHVFMFIQVMKTTAMFVPLAFLLILTFGLTFHFLLYQPELMGSPYFTTGYSFLKLLSMTTGDLSTDDFFGLNIDGQIQTNDHLPYITLTTIIWLLSLILMTILLSNLLIGLAVGDIKSISDKAEFKKLALQVNYVLKAESQLRTIRAMLCNWCTQKDKTEDIKTKEFEPNKEKSKSETIKMELVHFFWGGVRYDSQESIKKLILAEDDIFDSHLKAETKTE